MSHPHFTLISHHLCPYVQRAVIALNEKGIAYERIDINLSNKPAWFLKLSPLGKVPLLVVGDDGGRDSNNVSEGGRLIVLFESAVISEYIDTITGGELLSIEPLTRAQQRAWIEYASELLNNIARFYSASNKQAYNKALVQLEAKWQRLEENLSSGPYFNGAGFSLVDAAFAPALRYLAVFKTVTSSNFLALYPKVQQWHDYLAARLSVRHAVKKDYAETLTEFIAKRDSILGHLARAGSDLHHDVSAS